MILRSDPAGPAAHRLRRHVLSRPILCPTENNGRLIARRSRAATAIDAYVDALDNIAKAHGALVQVLNETKDVGPGVRDHYITAFTRDVDVISSTYAVHGGMR